MSVLFSQVEKIRRNITEDERHDLNTQVTKDYLDIESLKQSKKESAKEWDAKITPIQKRLNQNSRISKEGVMEEDRQVFCKFDTSKEVVFFFEDAEGNLPCGSRPMTEEEIENPNLFANTDTDVTDVDFEDDLELDPDQEDEESEKEDEEI